VQALRSGARTVTDMAGERNKRRVPTHEYQIRVRAIAEHWGWRERDVWFWFQQIAWLVEFEQRWPRECAEWIAYRHLIAIIDKRGAVPS
jgi:hypothetical protein